MESLGPRSTADSSDHGSHSALPILTLAHLIFSTYICQHFWKKVENGKYACSDVKKTELDIYHKTRSARLFPNSPRQEEGGTGATVWSVCWLQPDGRGGGWGQARQAGKYAGQAGQVRYI